MFLALRELRFARGRFLLMGAVVALMAALSVILSGLSSGLVDHGVSGLRDMKADSFAFDEAVTSDQFSRSTVDVSAAGDWRAIDGVTDATPVGSALVHAESDAGVQFSAALFGIAEGGFLAPELLDGDPVASAENGVVISEGIANEGLAIGDVITIDRIGTELTVVGTTGSASYGHVAIVYLPLATWQEVAYGIPGEVPSSAYEIATAIALQHDGELADTEVAGTAAISKQESFNASPGYEAETSTMLLIQVFLYVISALVVGAFFTVWTVQRQPEIALLKAMGASSGYVVRDALAQVLVVLLGATALGGAAGWALGAAMPEGMPFVLETIPVLTGFALIIVLGAAGALVAIRQITRVDPLTALGGAR
ncbi:ABC transporter permease [Salinibacterium sp. GXW1014]|uniref:ABC transporter permease n=1 Tax=Salinibacterium sp. GXW1014 TaxID=3377838 RepID=UPI00383B9FF8